MAETPHDAERVILAAARAWYGAYRAAEELARAGPASAAAGRQWEREARTALLNALARDAAAGADDGGAPGEG